MIKVEDAISNLKNQILRFAEGTEPDLALKMAIKALEQGSVLDKIRAEIEQLRLHKAKFITSDNKVCINSQEVFDIIDKYIEADKEADQ